MVAGHAILLSTRIVLKQKEEGKNCNILLITLLFSLHLLLLVQWKCNSAMNSVQTRERKTHRMQLILLCDYISLILFICFCDSVYFHCQRKIAFSVSQVARAHKHNKHTNVCFLKRSWKYANSIWEREINELSLPLTTFVYFSIICPFNCCRFVLPLPPLPPPPPLMLPLLEFVSIGFLSLNLWWDFFRNNWRKMFANFYGSNIYQW